MAEKLTTGEANQIYRRLSALLEPLAKEQMRRVKEGDNLAWGRSRRPGSN